MPAAKSSRLVKVCRNRSRFTEISTLPSGLTPSVPRPAPGVECIDEGWNRSFTEPNANLRDRICTTQSRSPTMPVPLLPPLRKSNGFHIHLRSRKMNHMSLFKRAMLGACSLLILAAPSASAAPAGTITICHATGSATNPFVTITVSQNGLHGHNGHANDIIPAPAGGCPTGENPPPPAPPGPPAPPAPTPPAPPAALAPPAAPAATPPAAAPAATPPAAPPTVVAGEAAVPAVVVVPARATVVRGSSLPFTGAPAALPVLLGLLFLLAGTALHAMPRLKGRRS